jgi:hypothetical protein
VRHTFSVTEFDLVGLTLSRLTWFELCLTSPCRMASQCFPILASPPILRLAVCSPSSATLNTLRMPLRIRKSYYPRKKYHSCILNEFYA